MFELILCDVFVGGVSLLHAQILTTLPSHPYLPSLGGTDVVKLF